MKVLEPAEEYKREEVWKVNACERALSWISDMKANWRVQSILASSYFSVLKGARITRLFFRRYG